MSGINIDELAELTYARQDPQFGDSDAFDQDEYLDRLRDIFDRMDELSGDIHKLLEEHEVRNVRNAYGALARSMEYLEREL